MFVTEVIRMKVKKSEKAILESLSLAGKNLYNTMLKVCLKGHSLELNNLLGLAYEIKRANACYNILGKDIIYSIAKRIKSGFYKYQKGLAQKPHLFKADARWFSLFFQREIEYANNKIILQLNGKSITIGLYGNVLKSKRIISALIIKKGNNYYLHVSLEKHIIKLASTGNSVAIDPNHVNFFMAIDNKGISYEAENIALIYYFDKQILKLKQKIARCQINSINYLKYNEVLDRIYLKRKTMLHDALYTLSNFLIKRYDRIAIGNYVPRKELASNKQMYYKMVKETAIGEFRDILEYVAKKYGRCFFKVDEKNTTAKCFYCGYYEKKNPDIRYYKCKKCNKIYNRDINSAINIGIKANILSAKDYVGLDLEEPTYALSYSHTSGLSVKKLNDLNDQQ